MNAARRRDKSCVEISLKSGDFNSAMVGRVVAELPGGAVMFITRWKMGIAVGAVCSRPLIRLEVSRIVGG